MPKSNYTLLGSLRSPFVRMCRMLMTANKIDFEFRVLNITEDPKAAEALAKESPINRIPILIDGDQKIFDSRVIMNHLTRKHGLKTLSIDEENQLSAVYSCLDTALILFFMKKEGYDMNHPGYFLSRHRARIPANLEYLTPWASKLDPSKPGDWNFVSMGLFGFLHWANAREIIKLSDYPELGKFMDRFKDAPGVQGTGF